MPIDIVPYDVSWPARFEREAARLRAALGEVAVAVEHVGSTSVPGLAAKDVIDIQVAVAGFAPEARFRDPLERLGYVHREDPENPDHRFFKLDGDGGRRLVNIHVCEAGSEWERRHLVFRDLLRSRPDVASEYERLKRDLAPRFEVAADHSNAKSDFIARVMRRFSRTRPRPTAAPP
jgi:GrpB-like predicted nucleotidyltransferase (UPF0157 family)